MDGVGCPPTHRGVPVPLAAAALDEEVEPSDEPPYEVEAVPVASTNFWITKSRGKLSSPLTNAVICP